MVDRIEAAWLHTANFRKIIEILGAENVRFVGGAVRDTLAGRAVKDIDIATKWLPLEAKGKLEKAGIKVIPTGLQHGTITALADAESVEITTLRRDVTTDGRHAEVAFTDDWHVDATRRDFTMNALYAASDGTLFDPFGGVADLAAGRVRFIGDARERIREDGLRIMRFFRFHTGYGVGEPDEEGLAAVRGHLSMLNQLSVERVRDEVLKLLAYSTPYETVCMMQEIGLWHYTPLSRVDLNALKRLCDGEVASGVSSSPLARLAVLSGKASMALSPLTKALRLSKADARRARLVLEAMEAPTPHADHDIRCLVYCFGQEAAATAVTMQASSRRDWYDIVQAWNVPDLPVKGRDIIAGGVTPGPAVTKLLKQAEACWIASDFTLAKQDLLEGVLGS